MLAPDASKLADDCWRVQVTNARLQGCTATEVTATSPKRPDASCRHPDREQHRIRDGRAPRAYSEVAHQASKSCSLRCTNACAPGAGGVSPPWLAEPHRQGSATFAMHERMCMPGARGGVSPPWFTATHVQGSATFAMHECVCIRSGGRQPPVARETARWTNACAQERGASAPRGVTHCSFGGLPTHTLASASAVTVPHPRRAHARRSCVGMRTFAGEIATFAMDERMCTRSGGRQPPVARETAPCSLPTDARRTRTGARASARQHSRRADARRSCVRGESAACLCVAISLARAFS
jgi:hypothetical protein